MTPTFSLVVNHTPWREDRVAALREMQHELQVVRGGLGFVTIGGARTFATIEPPPSYVEACTLINDTDHRGRDWQGGAKLDWQLTQWTWSRAQPVTHHVFLTDDLHLAPGFWKILLAMVEARPSMPIGLLSNHPLGPGLFDAGHHGYRTASWLVGPAYVIPHEMMAPFLGWFMQQPNDKLRGPQSWNDDNSWNEFITTQWRATTWHPLPTIVEHRADLPSTVGHGDRHSRERISWRARRCVVEGLGGGFKWESDAWSPPHGEAGISVGPDHPLSGQRRLLEEMSKPDFWKGEAPLLSVGG